MLPVSLAVLLRHGGDALATGAFHEDGLADSVDGFGGGWDARAMCCEIMKDSRIGSYGAIGIGIAAAGEVQSLCGVRRGRVDPADFAGGDDRRPRVSRFASTTLIYALDYARDDDSSKSKPLATRMRQGELAVAALFGLAPCLLLPVGQVAHRAGRGRVRHLAGRAATSSSAIGGYTGDCLGATQQLTEIAFYLGLLCDFT